MEHGSAASTDQRRFIEAQHVFCVASAARTGTLPTGLVQDGRHV